MSDEDELLHDAIAMVLSDSGDEESVRETRSVLREYPLQVIPATGACRKILYTTKLSWLLQLTDGRTDVSEDIALIGGAAPLTGPHRDVVRAIVQAAGAPLRFVGDLDPWDLLTFATLYVSADQPTVAAEYLGISDTWIDRCEKDLAEAGRSLSGVCIKMGPEERRGFERLQQLPVDWAGIVGPRAFAMLGSGVKLELEGASNPKIYSRTFHVDLLETLVG
jgi:hypothetical protein